MPRFIQLYERRDPSKSKKYEKKVERVLRKGRPKLGDEMAGVEMYNDLIDAGKSFEQAVHAIGNKFGITDSAVEERLKRHGIRRPSEGESARKKRNPVAKVKQYTQAMREKLFKNPDTHYQRPGIGAPTKYPKNKILVPRLRLPDQPQIRGNEHWVGSYDAESISVMFHRMSKISDMNVVRVVVDVPRKVFDALDSPQVNEVMKATAKAAIVYAKRYPTEVFVFDRTDIMNSKHKTAFEVLSDTFKNNLGFIHDKVGAYDIYGKDAKKIAAFKKRGRNVNEDLNLADYLDEPVTIYPLRLLEAHRARVAGQLAMMAAGGAMMAVGMAGVKAPSSPKPKAKIEHQQSDKSYIGTYNTKDQKTYARKFGKP